MGELSRVRTGYGDETLVVRPNWSEQVTERYEFRTSVTESRNGVEDRAAIRRRPAISIRYTADTMADKTDDALEQMFEVPTDDLWLTPIPTFRARATGPHDVGFTVITLSELCPYWMAVGDKLVIETDSHREVVEIDALGSSAGAGLVTITAGLQAEFDGANVYLAKRARLDDQTDRAALVASHGRFQVQATVPPSESFELPPDASLPVFEGLPVWIRPPNWRDSIRQVLLRDRWRFDPKIGRDYVARRNDFTRLQISMTYTFFSRDELTELLGFFCARYGRRESFYMPSFMSDMTLASAITDGANTITVQGTRAKAIYDASVMHQCLIVKSPDGCRQPNRIESVEIVDGNTRFTVADDWGDSFPTDSTVEWMFYCRLDTDALEIRWLSDGRCEVPFTVKTFDPQIVVDAGLGGGFEVSGTVPWSYPAVYDDDSLLIRADGVPQEAIDRGLIYCVCEMRASVRENLGDPGPANWFGYASFRAVEDDGTLYATSTASDLFSGTGYVKNEGYLGTNVSQTLAYIEFGTAITPSLAIWSQVLSYWSRARVIVPGLGYLTQEGRVWCP